jgi:2-(1,2-epoxy-1,2-dihydrophenyl)acetyl-CoA isomerase
LSVKIDAGGEIADTMIEPLAQLIAGGPVLLRLDARGVAHLQLNRPEASNGLNLELLEAMKDALLLLQTERRARALVITGAGKHFCAGGDVHAFLAKGAELPAYIDITTRCLQAVVTLLIGLQVPVISAVQGFAAGGGGLGLVCSSDFVIAAQSSQFLAGATRVAMVPDAGVSVSLTHLVGFRKAMQIVMLNPILTATQAQQIGLITTVVDDERLQAEAFALAHRLALGAPAALGATKRLLWSGLGRSVESAMPDENRTQVTLSGMKDALEGLAAVIEKRAPNFTGLDS